MYGDEEFENFELYLEGEWAQIIYHNVEMKIL